MSNLLKIVWIAFFFPKSSTFAAPKGKNRKSKIENRKSKIENRKTVYNLLGLSSLQPFQFQVYKLLSKKRENRSFCSFFVCLFCTFDFSLSISICGCGEIGRHARLRIWCRKAWGFESLHPHRFLWKPGRTGLNHAFV